ncbi:MAG: endo-1,4-beta-xylanase [Oscillospiraceae bacterium]|nr:endo-1,4-beta-xylanase [Oscillospiraceae bacterium]MBR6837025.1 endo-1,4-beta-xylanase [Oscillospiraceae bacterium]
MNNSKRIMAGIASLAMLAGVVAAFPVQPEKVSAEDDVIFSADFEDGKEDGFSRRGEDETVEVVSEGAHGGDNCLSISTRKESWNGPQVALDDVIEAGTQYIVTAYAKTPYYSKLTLSMQFDDAEGTTHYDNVLPQDCKDGDWLKYEAKVSFPAGSTNKFLYFEAADANCTIFVDDFKISNVPDVAIEDLTSLRAYYADYFKIGTALTPSDLASKPFMKLVDKHFSGSITVGNELKPDYVLNNKATLAYMEENGDDENPQVSLASAKPVLDYCVKNNIPLRAHTLVWHSQTPEWFFKENYDAKGEYVSKEKMLKRMENYIKNVFAALAKEYPTLNIYACDVVNEAWLEDGTPRKPGHPSESNQWGASDWVAVFGDNSFIDYAFEYARKYAPKGCKLYYNDYNEYMDKKKQIVEMATRLKEKGVIDGIGMQAHLDCRQSMDAAFPSPQMFEQAVKEYVATGLDVQITELDVTVPEKSGDKYFEHQAKYYDAIMNVAEKYKDNISAVIFWGVTDDNSWRAPQNPLIFDSEFKAKPAYYSIIEGLTPGEIPTNAPAQTAVASPTVKPTATASPTVKPTESASPTVKPTESASPTVKPTESASPTVKPTESATPTVKPTEKTVAYGDIDLSGTIDVTDLTQLSLYLLKDVKFNEDEKKCADVNADGNIDLTDLATLRQFISKKISKLGA